ncbi:uncharacterized protein LOC105665149 [Ceratitis capitata]|uniref:uncharacterized protein LOC105665149 n=1 Tax=Ceratitis capitata TaxID=7213 RepID=UPI00061884E1|nr:uncharacterized protein LOC105665149 [Ceratitis capitata]
MNLILIIASISAIICQTFGRNHADQSKINSGALNDVCEAKSSWTIVANTENCHQFWICVNGKAEKFDCAANFYFDREEKRCKIGECPMEQSTTKCKSHNVRHIEGNCEAFLLFVSQSPSTPTTNVVVFCHLMPP